MLKLLPALFLSSTALLSLVAAVPSFGRDRDDSYEDHAHAHGGAYAYEHGNPAQTPLGFTQFADRHPEPLYYKDAAGHKKTHWMPGDDLLPPGGDGETQADAIFSGVGTFAHLPLANCFGKDSDETFDIAFLGLPFDTGTSYRPGARFGPSGIRQGSRRLTLYGGYNVALDVNPFRDWAKLVDCGDVPVTPYDSGYAIKQMAAGHQELMHKDVHTAPHALIDGRMQEVQGLAKSGKVPPRVISLGGDHTVVLPILRSINSVYGPISVIHFDSHLDTWKPIVFGGEKSETASINHGTYFYHAAQEGLIANGTSIHAGIRTTLSGPSDYDNDRDCGFHLVEAREIDRIGTAGIIKRIRETVGDTPVYLSIDIDVLDPSAAPATGTPETGGWSTRELRTIIRGLEGLTIVGADVVEVATPYDGAAEQTLIAAADTLYEVMSLMVKKGPLLAQ